MQSKYITKYPKSRVHFSALPIGAIFYDVDFGGKWVKLHDLFFYPYTNSVCIETEGGHLQGLYCSFEPNDSVSQEDPNG